MQFHLKLVRRRSRKKVFVRSNSDVYKLFKHLSSEFHEHLYALFLNPALELLGTYLVAKGPPDGLMVSPAEIIRVALLAGATGIILVHNHPSGNLDPSAEDIHFTKSMINACDLMAIKFIDHVIIADGSYSSIMNKI